jgi:4-amino-4-deoxy-L-arabinose transferase-like glycosyltransferase
MVTAYSNLSVYKGQFTGEDEPFQWIAVTNLIHTLRNGNLMESVYILATQDQPPLRYILSIPGILIWPHSEIGLRLIAIIFSFIMTYQIYRLGTEIGGESVGVLSSLLIAASGVYNWTSMAFGWSIIVTCMILVTRMLCTGSLNFESGDGKKKYALSNLLIIVMFLINTGNILFFITLSLIALWENRKRINLWLLHTIPAGLFYALYYLFFFFYAVSLWSPTGKPIGQLAHNLARAGGVSAGGLSPLIDNLKGINAYFFPYLSWIVLVALLWTLAVNQKKVFVWFSLYIFSWSFLLSISTAQYFLLFFIALMPFGIKALFELVKPYQFKLGGAICFCLILMWNQTLFINHYGSNDPNYPYSYLKYGMAAISRQHNIYEPYSSISSDLRRLLKYKNGFVSDLSGSFAIFYYRKDMVEIGSAGFMGILGSKNFRLIYNHAKLCFQPAWDSAFMTVVLTTHIICPQNIDQVYAYPRSKIRIYTLK